MKKILILITMFILAAASVSAMTISSVSNQDMTLAGGKYIPYENHTLPVGETVEIICEHNNQNNTISTPDTIIDDLGYYMTVTTSDLCTIGDEIRACVYLNPTQCSDWVEVEEFMGSGSGWGYGMADIFGVPEYSTLSAGILVLLTGAGIVSLRRKYK